MDIEDLNKTQIILLTLLVSFVTSIATGIVTVSLVEQAPPGFTQTVNRVVERTVEKVVPTKQGNSTTVKETTVVVKEEDLLTKSIEKNQGAIFSIKVKSSNEDGTPAEVFLGWATLLSSDGVLVTDLAILGEGDSYISEDYSGKRREVTVMARDHSTGVALLKLVRAEGDKAVLNPTSLVDDSSVRPGQSAISFGGRNKRSVAVGIISSVVKGDTGSASSTQPLLKSVEASVNPPSGTTGAPLTNIFGEMIGLSVLEQGDISYVSVSLIRSLLSKQK